VSAEPARPLALAALAGACALRLHRTARRGLRETIRTSRAVARAGPELGVVYGRVARRRLARPPRPDGVVQIGAGYLPPDGLQLVTLEDITVLQALELGYPEFRLLSRRAVAARVERQRRVYERARACCVTTGWVAHSLVADYGVPPEKVHVVGVGRNHDVAPAERDWSRPRFLFVGKDWEGKNGPTLLRAFARVRAEAPEARLEVVGHHPPLDAPGVTGHGFLALASAAGRERLERLYREATCFVLPSRYEASALVYVEAGAAGLPSIGTAVGGSRELIGEGGCVVDPRDEDALVAAMLRLCDGDEARRLGEAARRRSDLFTWEAVGGRILRALQLPGAAAELPAFL